MQHPRTFTGHLPRIALAIECMAVGTPHCVLAHVESATGERSGAGSYSLFFSPLDELTTISHSIAVLSRVTPPERWQVVGICAPTVIRGTFDGDEVTRRSAWLIHVMDTRRRTASRLAVPAEPRLSGPTSAIDPVDRLEHCFERLLGLMADPVR